MFISPRNAPLINTWEVVSPFHSADLPLETKGKLELRGDNGIASRIISFIEVNERSGRGRRGAPGGNCDSGWEQQGKRKTGRIVAERNLCPSQLQRS